MGTTKNEIVPVTESFVALRPEYDIREVMEMNLGGGEGISLFDFERVKLGAGGSTSFTIESPDGEEDTVKTFEALICHRVDQRSYWSVGMDEGGGATPPDCSSFDLQTGYGDNGNGDGEHACRTCPKNQWGSDPKGGKGKACSQTVKLMLLRQGAEASPFPSVLSVPAGSLKQFNRYMFALTAKGVGFKAGVHKFSLEKDTSATGVVFAKLKVELVRKLEDAEAERVEAYGEAIAATLSAMAPEGRADSAEPVSGEVVEGEATVEGDDDWQKEAAATVGGSE